MVKSFLKKFHESWPFTEYMATKLAESIPSLRNLSPMPGAVEFDDDVLVLGKYKTTDVAGI